MTAGLAQAPARPRIGFAGLGWIGAQRMQVLAEGGTAEIAAVCDPAEQALAAACATLPATVNGPPLPCSEFGQLLEQPLDGIVIATPNALHETQTAAALDAGMAVFCQKPLALTRSGTERLLGMARKANLALGIDWSYRYLAGVPELKRLIAAGEIGRVTHAELCFHNAYGPGAAWYYDVGRSGGGCLLDLGCHLLDLCHWLLGAREPRQVRGHCFLAGERLPVPVRAAEDFVTADIAYAEGLHVHLSCSWRSSAGRGAIIDCRIFGTGGGAGIRNVNGSFYDFEVTLHRGATSTVLGAPPDAWPGRALVDWAGRLPGGADTDTGLDHAATTAEVIERIYGHDHREPFACA